MMRRNWSDMRRSISGNRWKCCLSSTGSSMDYLMGRANGQCHYIAYRYNPFELEAFTHDPDEHYLRKRRPFAWISYVREFFKSIGKDHSKNVPAGKKISWYRSPRT